MKKLLLFIAIVSLFGCGSCAVQKDVVSSQKAVTHEIFDQLLKKYVDNNGKVNYEGFVKDSNELNRYLKVLSSSHPNDKNWSKSEQLAYWINTYNAFTIKIVADNYPIASIKDVKNGIPFVNTVWDIKFIKIENQVYDLNNIEHGIIRPKFEDPRIHFAVNCASISCPNLRNEAFNAESLDKQLNEQAERFINDLSKNQITASNPKLSKVFLWFAGDFKKKKPVIAFINDFAKVKISEKADLNYNDYDWALNKQ